MAKVTCRRDFKALEKRRRRGMQLLACGRSQAEVADRLKVSTAAVCQWAKKQAAHGDQAWKKGRLGRPEKITEKHRAVLARELPKGAQAHGFMNELWTLPRIAEVLHRHSGYACIPDIFGAYSAKWVGACSDRKSEPSSGMKTRSPMGRGIPGRHLKKARREDRTIVFIDECGLSERPNITRTWAPEGQTPQLEFSFNWGNLSVIAGVTGTNFYFRCTEGRSRHRKPWSSSGNYGPRSTESS